MIHGGVEDFNTDRTNLCFTTMEDKGECWDRVKLA